MWRISQKATLAFVIKLQRPALLISLNIAEGAAEKARFYRITRRSATECVSIIYICRCLKFVEKNLLVNERELLLRVAAILTRMIKVQVKMEDSNS
ncbi:four helix bundle protein [Candidatus Uabimicrobium sp. HlEnr_7]|uniref:four helix bundle protein n=1 Tax=Candidatus Uabimicrobium helgolandensis TaxID=3095367 RepID=UPI0035569CBF